MKLLNIGCGARPHESWVNIDLVSNSKLVLRHDIRKPLPFPSGYFDAIYSSHVLEHIEKDRVPEFLGNLRRVLKPGGVLRIVVPDFERQVRTYLEKLDGALRSDSKSAQEYEWIMLEIFDQMVRTRQGGAMKPFIEKASSDQMNFIIKRIGSEAQCLRLHSNPAPLMVRIKNKSPKDFLAIFQTRLCKILIGVFLGKKMQSAFEDALFRGSGEIHYWAYDRYSLKTLLESHGFNSVECVGPNESRIQNFSYFKLDSCSDVVRKPDSIFVEARSVK